MQHRICAPTWGVLGGPGGDCGDFVVVQCLCLKEAHCGSRLKTDLSVVRSCGEHDSVEHPVGRGGCEGNDLFKTHSEIKLRESHQISEYLLKLRVKQSDTV